MRYPIAIEMGHDGTAFGVVVPDLPGCFSAGDTLDEAIRNVEEAALTWIVVTLAAGGDVPAPSTIEAIRGHSDYAGWPVTTIDIDTPQSFV